MTIAELRALLAKGALKPLRLECCDEHGRVTVPAHICFGVRGADGAYAKSGHDMQLHVAAVNALPYLLDVVEETAKYLKDGGQWHEQRIKIAEAIARVSERTP